MINKMKRERKEVIVIVMSLLFMSLFMPFVSAGLFQDFNNWITNLFGDDNFQGRGELANLGAFAGDANINIIPSSLSINNGDVFDVDITINSVTDLYGFQFDLQFDSAILQVESTSKGSFLESDEESVFFGSGIITSGYLDDVFISRYGVNSGVDGSGVLATIRFKAIGVGSSSINILNVELLDSSIENINPIVSNGNVNVQTLIICVDADGDGYGVCPNCGTVNGCVNDGDDCDDTVESGVSINPDATEICDGVDNNCINGIDESGDALCDNTLFCDGAETCQGISGCQDEADPVCNDGIACSDDFCNNEISNCDADFSECECFNGLDSECTDNNVCNGAEICNLLTLMCEAGTGLSCNDNNICNGIETCDSIIGCQSGTPLVCTDNNVCNGIETCDSIIGCQSGTPLVCESSDFCIDDSCDSILGCQTSFNTAPCNDLVSCTTNDVCSLGICSGTTNDSLCEPWQNCNPISDCQQQTCSNCEECDTWFTGCDYDECHNNCDWGTGCYFIGIVVGDNCIDLTSACISISSCSDYSEEECTNHDFGDPCDIAVSPLGCEWDGNDCVEEFICIDTDGDGYDAISVNCPSGNDCDDNDLLEFPGQIWYLDKDDDDYSDGTSESICERPLDYKTQDELENAGGAISGDCNDLNSAINPGVIEDCTDTADNDCDGDTDCDDRDDCRTHSSCIINEDVNKDGYVNIDDMVQAGPKFGRIDCDETINDPCNGADVTRDGKVSIIDFVSIGLKFDY